MSEHYAVLGVPSNASMEQVRSAYRRLARLHHPDHGGSVAAFHVVQEAHHVLGDPQRRAGYDEEIGAHRARLQHQRRDESLIRERDRREVARARATSREYVEVPPGWGMDGRLVTQRREAAGPARVAGTTPESGVDLAFRFVIAMLWGATAGMVLVVVFVVWASVFVT